MSITSDRLKTAPGMKPSMRGLGGPVLVATAGVVVVGLIGVLWFGLIQRERGGVGESAVPFKTAPDFSLGLFDGSTLRLTDALKDGQPLVLNFWASWCVPCADEAPILESAARRESGKARFVGVDVQDVESDARAFLRKYNVTYANGAGNAGPISVSYGMRGIPETYFITPSGEIIRKWNGPLTAAGLDQFLAELRRASARPGN